MALINENYLNLKQSYLFSTIAKKVSEYSERNPGKKLIKLGIGDVTRPLVPAVIEALHKAVDEMGKSESFRGYGPEQGYEFLREAIAKNDYRDRGIDISKDEIFVSDGAKSDMGNIGDIFGIDNIAAISDPVYPVYVDTNTMSGRKIIYLDGNCENGFCPNPPSEVADIIYICSPNNPTGAVMTKEQLSRWVRYANENGSVILFDSAYEAFIQDRTLPRSIYEIEGAKTCAIEFRSFSKTAGFTGLRCGYAVVPKALKAKTASGDEKELNQLWNRRHTTKFNGTAYIVQRAAEAVYSADGRRQIEENIAYYLENARLIKTALEEMGFTVFGGENAPYIWLRCSGGMGSWEFFDCLLNNIQVIGTPGEGFGKMGEGYFRLTAFGSREATLEAIERIKTLKL